MTNKEWFIVITEGQGCIYRYVIQHWLMPMFESQEAYAEWENEIKDYFVKRTSIQERILAIEPSPVISAYSMVND